MIRATWFLTIKTKLRPWTIICGSRTKPGPANKPSTKLSGQNLQNHSHPPWCVSPNKTDDLYKDYQPSGPDSIAPTDLRLIGEASAEGRFTVLRHCLLNSTVWCQWKVSRMLTTHKKGNKQGGLNSIPECIVIWSSSRSLTWHIFSESERIFEVVLFLLTREKNVRNDAFWLLIVSFYNLIH